MAQKPEKMAQNQVCRAGFAADTEKGLQNLVQPLDLLSVAGSRIHIVVQCRLQHLMTDLLPDEILIETVVQQMRNVGFSQLVRGTALDLQLVTEVIQLHFDVVRRLNVEKVWLPCHLDYDSSMKAFLFRTDIDVWGDKPFFTSEIQTGIGKIVLKAPKTTIGKEVEDWLRDRKKIVIWLESKTVPDDPASILEPCGYRRSSPKSRPKYRDISASCPAGCG